MLKKYFFISPDSSARFLIFTVILMMFSYKLFLIFAFSIIMLLLLFRKKSVNHSLLRTTDPTIALALCDGKLDKVITGDKKQSLMFSVGPFKHYGIRMPFSGVVKSYVESKEKFFSIGRLTIYRYKTTLKLSSAELGTCTLKFENITNLSRVKIWARSGDKARAGAYLGYLPFGGKIAIQFAQDLSVLVHEKDSVLSAQTLLISKGKINAG